MSANKASTWGIYDEHLRAWIVSPTLPRERDAWNALLEIDSLHPWELRVRSHEEAKPVVVMAECPECGGLGDCDGCGRDCTLCEGEGEVPWEDLPDWQQASMKRTGRAPKEIAA